MQFIKFLQDSRYRATTITTKISKFVVRNRNHDEIIC